MTDTVTPTVTAELLHGANVQRTLYPLARVLGVPSYASMAKPVLVDAILAHGYERVSVALQSLGSAAAPVPAAPASALEDAIRAIAAQVAPRAAQLDAEAVRGIVRDVIAEELPGMSRRVIVERHDAEPVDVGIQHADFPVLLAACSARLPDGHRCVPWLYGPAGTGKTHAARAVAQALGLPFAFTGALDGAYGLLGFVDAGGRVVRTPFRECWENGGVFLFDEIDASHPSAVVAFNAALGNGTCAFPDATVERHPDCVVIAAANTTGHGGTSQYTGRVRQDGASLDRFVVIPWDIDPELERALCRNPRWLAAVRAARATVAERRLSALVTPRATIKGEALLAQGLTVETVVSLVLRCGLEEAPWQDVRTAAMAAWDRGAP